MRTVYVEREVRDHPRTRRILARLGGVCEIPIERYGEVFNRRAQSFRLQKTSPALVLARKAGEHVLPTPEGYGFPGFRNLYFSHMLNCLYDCRYCFLQGMFRSAHYVLFVDYEDFHAACASRVRDAGETPCFFFSGYDCDSLAFEKVSGFAAGFLDFFSRLDDAWLELRTKSTSIGVLLERAPLPRCVVAWSLSPREVADAVEHGAPSLERRLAAMARTAAAGWKLGLRFDPLLWHGDWRSSYRALFREVFERVPLASVHSVSVGAFRLPAAYFRRMVRERPEEALFAAPVEERSGVVTYREDLLDELEAGVTSELARWVPRERLHACG